MTLLRWHRVTFLLAALMGLGAWDFDSNGQAWGLITGGEGNDQLSDPGWPAGAAAVFNHPARVAYWVGPPFGGGQWHAECRGDSEQFNVVLEQFARIEANVKRLVVHDGVGRSFWLNPNREAGKQAAAAIDWTFVVWQPASWEQLRKMPVDLISRDLASGGDEPPVQIDVYVGGAIEWSAVRVPGGIEVIDQRLEAHGFTAADGTVLQGVVKDLDSGAPLRAHVKLQTREAMADGGYDYRTVGEAAAEASGKWTLRHIPDGPMRVVVEAEGYVPRVAGHFEADGQPSWRAIDCALVPPGKISGRVVDESGQPIGEAHVQLRDVAASDGRYEGPSTYETVSDQQGRFQIESAPRLTARIWLDKPGYVARGLGTTVTAPAEDLELRMERSALLRVTVDFAASSRPPEYIVQIEPEGGSQVGSWGGSSRIDANNQVSFDGVPPGKYVLIGQPNPCREGEETDPVTIELKPGVPLEATIVAKPWAP